MRTLLGNNPATRIESNYTALMSIEDLETLKAEALALVEKGGISTKNAAKFRQIVKTEQKLDRLRAYLTNFLLAACGLSVAS
jgi:ERCC4-type nuclease